MNLVKNLFYFRASKPVGSQVPHNQVGDCSSCNKYFSLVSECSGQGLRVLHNLLRVVDEVFSLHLLQLASQGCDLMVVGTSLEHGKNSEIDLL